MTFEKERLRALKAKCENYLRNITIFITVQIIILFHSYTLTRIIKPMLDKEYLNFVLIMNVLDSVIIQNILTYSLFNKNQCSLTYLNIYLFQWYQII